MNYDPDDQIYVDLLTERTATHGDNNELDPESRQRRNTVAKLVSLPSNGQKRRCHTDSTPRFRYGY